MNRNRIAKLVGWLRTGAALAAFVLVLAPGSAQAVPSSTPDSSAYVANNTVRTVNRANGLTYIGGDFTTLRANAQRSAIFNTSGQRTLPQLDVFYSGGNAQVVASAPDGSGGFYVGGLFSSIGGVPRDNIAHILADGSVDPAFNPDANDRVQAIAVSGSNVYVGGFFTQIGGEARNRIAKLSAATGNAFSAWNPNANALVRTLAVSGTALYVGGDFNGNNSIGGADRDRIAKLSTSSGNAFSAWDPDANNNVSTIAVSGSSVYVGGAFNGADSIGGEDRNRIAKLSGTTGNAFSTWNPGANNEVTTLATDGTSVYAGGLFSGVNSIGGEDRNRIAKLAASNGSVSTTWNPNASAIVSALALSGTSLYVGGDFTSIGGASRQRLARLSTTSGNASSSFNPDVNDNVWAVSVSGSKVHAGGDFTSTNPIQRQRIAALDSNGVPTAWNPNATNGSVHAIAVDSDGHVYAGGSFTTAGTIGGLARNRIAKLSGASGNAFSAWNPGADSTVFALDTDGSVVYAGGAFDDIGGLTREGIAKISTSSGGVFQAFDASPVDFNVEDIAAGGSVVYAGGVFTQIGGLARNKIAKLSATTGEAFAGWNPDANSYVQSLILDGSVLYAGGGFTQIGANALTRNHVAKLSTSNPGDAFAAWDPNADSNVFALALSGVELYAGGQFANIGGLARNRLAALSTDSGNAFSGFNPNANAQVNGLAASSDGVYVGGDFTTVGGGARPFPNYVQFTE